MGAPYAATNPGAAAYVGRKGVYWGGGGYMGGFRGGGKGARSIYGT